MTVTAQIKVDPETFTYRLYDPNGKLFSQGSLHDPNIVAWDIRAMAEDAS